MEQRHQIMAKQIKEERHLNQTVNNNLGQQ